MNLNGYQIHTDINMVKYEQIQVKRTFFERLFSFTPFQKTKTITNIIPSTEIIIYQNNLIMHPITRDALLKDKRLNNGRA